MKYQIMFTDTYGMSEEQKKPCRNAYKGTIEYLDVRCYKTPEEFKECQHEDWFSRGYNHRMFCGCIARNLFTEECWYVDINTIEELMSLKEEVNNEIIIRTSYENRETPCIEIYNDYRE